MLGTEHRMENLSGLVAWAGRDRASKVVAAAATIAHGWDRLDATELERLAEALDDHTRAYLEWIADLRGPEIHDLRGVVTAISSANAMFRQTNDATIRRRLAAMLGRTATTLVDRINAASLAVDLD